MCAHDGFHSVRTEYDRRRALLVYFWVCEVCDARLGEVKREAYRPSYDPHGSARFLRSGGLEHADVAAPVLADAAGVDQKVDVSEHL